MFNKVIIDVDNTLTDINPTLRIIERVFDKDKLSEEAIDSFTLASAYGIPTKEEQQFWADYEPEIIDKSVLHPRASKIFDNYIDENTEIIILSSRAQKFLQPTIEWLKTNVVPYDIVECIGHGYSKAKYIKEHYPDADAIFEDNDRTLEYLKDMDITRIAVDYPYNHDVDVDIRLHRETGDVWRGVIANKLQG